MKAIAIGMKMERYGTAGFGRRERYAKVWLFPIHYSTPARERERIVLEVNTHTNTQSLFKRLFRMEKRLLIKFYLCIYCEIVIMTILTIITRSPRCKIIR